MSEFKKYHGIENHYREKFINEMFEYHPEYKNCVYIAQEKIDGANFQVIFRKEGNDIKVEYGKRNGLLASDESFYGWQSVVEQQRFKDFINAIKYYMVYSPEAPKNEFIFFGELYGKDIQKRIDYGPSKYLKFYDAIADGKYLRQLDFEYLMHDLEFADLIVPVIGYYDNFDEAMQVDVEVLETKINTASENEMCEGIVIKPYGLIATNKDGKQIIFYVKKKAEKFKDKEKVRKRQKKKVEISDNLKFAQEVFDSYITENRLKDMFAKEGMIENTGQIGKYIKLVVDDAREDFLKDHSELYDSLDGKEQKKVSANAGKILSKLCFKYV